jgi:hypothetical protein
VDISTDDSTRPRLDRAPPQPPRQGRSLMAMASDGSDGKSQSIDMSSPAVRTLAAMGQAKQKLMELASLLPTLAPGIQQIITGLEQVVPQQVADMISGNPPGSGGSGLEAPQANAAPTAPPVQTGM